MMMMTAHKVNCVTNLDLHVVLTTKIYFFRKKNKNLATEYQYMQYINTTETFS